jgi:pSer/pThr/pTyr-binding forkhead associated (FHA) protein
VIASKCPKCQHELPEGVKTCPACGHAPGTITHDTLVTDADAVQADAILAGYGSTKFEERTRLVIYIKGKPDPVIAVPDQEYVIGRRTSEDDRIDLDLSPFGGGQSGVSRQHAVIRRAESGLVIVDEGSRNGTFVNEEPVTSGVPFPLHDGDVIRVGRVVMHIYFG